MCLSCPSSVGSLAAFTMVPTSLEDRMETKPHLQGPMKNEENCCLQIHIGVFNS